MRVQVRCCISGQRNVEEMRKEGGSVKGGGSRLYGGGGEGERWGLGGFLLDRRGDRGRRGRCGGGDGGDGCKYHRRGEFEVGDVLVLVLGQVPNGFIGGDVEGVRVLKLGLELLDVGVEGFFFVKAVELLTGSVGEVVEGDLGKDMGEGGARRGLEGEVGERTEVVLEGSGGMGNVVLIDGVESRGPRDGRRH